MCPSTFSILFCFCLHLHFATPFFSNVYTFSGIVIGYLAISLYGVTSTKYHTERIREDRPSESVGAL